MVDQLPHAAAHKARILVDRLPVILQVARALPHGVGVLAQEEGFAALLLAILDHIGHRGIHLRDHIRGFSLLVALIMDGAGGIQLADGVRHGDKVYAVARFIAQRPGDDRGMVAVAFHHAHAAVDKLFFPDRIGGDQVIRAHMHNAVALQIGLVHHIQTIFIAQVEKSGVGRVMAGAHGVQVVALHHQHVLDHAVHRRVGAQQRVRVVPVCAFQLDRHAVDQKDAVLDLHLAEANALAFHLAVHGDQQRIQVRGFRRPGLHIGDGGFKACAATPGVGMPLRDDFLPIQHLEGYARGAADQRGHRQCSGGVRVVQRGVRLHIGDVRFAEA